MMISCTRRVQKRRKDTWEMDLVISVQFKALQLLKLPLDLDKVPMRLSLRRHQDLDLPRLL